MDTALRYLEACPINFILSHEREKETSTFQHNTFFCHAFKNHASLIKKTQLS